MSIRLTSLAGAGLLMLTSLAVAGDGDFNLSLQSTYTASARIYHSPRSSDATLRNDYSTVNDILSIGGELRYRIPSTFLAVGIAAEYLSAGQNGQFPVVIGNQVFLLPSNERFRFIPVELSAMTILPFSGPQVSIVMGGGIGFYYGRRSWTVADTNVPLEKSGFGVGLHIITGIDYMVGKNVAIRGLLKFRDPQFDVANRFDTPYVRYQQTSLPLGQSEYYTRINVDGIAFTVGIVYYF